jgi:nucleoside-diphosphate-sugar epimerase
MIESPRKRIAIVGAFGFVGRNLMQHLTEHTDFEVVACSRSERQSNTRRIECRTMDLYSLKETIEAFRDCDYAVYLVHSMAPHSRLEQGHFRDFDFILADNFARACKSVGIGKCIYVGGMVPAAAKISLHLQSREEVEITIREHVKQLVSLRCGLVIGEEGSSYSIVVKLVERLPIMILPAWMYTHSQPIAIKDLCHAVVCAIEDQSCPDVIDMGMHEKVSYKDILLATAKEMGKKKLLIDVPYVAPKLSALWISLMTGAPMDLVYPLIDSIRYPMIKQRNHQIPPSWPLKLSTLEEAVRDSFSLTRKFQVAKVVSAKIVQESEVRSIQRMDFPIPDGCSAVELAKVYMHWLSRFLFLLVYLRSKENTYAFYLRFSRICLLRLALKTEVSTPDRQIYRVAGGLLCHRQNRGRFEFRESPRRDFLMITLHNYRPAMPWYFYRLTQAWFHKMVMVSFGRYLKSGRFMRGRIWQQIA